MDTPSKPSVPATLSTGADRDLTITRPKASPEMLFLNALAGTGAGARKELPPGHREPFPMGGEIARDAVPVQSTKRPLDTLSEIEIYPSSAKRVRPTPADAQPTKVGDQRADQVDKTILHQPKPEPPRRPCASLLREFIHSGDPSLYPLSTNIFVSEWLESTELDRGQQSPSDSHFLHRSDSVPSQLPRSASEMDQTYDSDGFAIPQTPTSPGVYVETPGWAPSDISNSRRPGKSLVENPLYRSLNLAANHIYMRPLHEQMPEKIAGLVKCISQGRNSPGPSPDEIRQDNELQALWMGTGESRVEEYFKRKIFPGASGNLRRSDRQQMAKHAVPNSGHKFKVSTPAPDILYGYNNQLAFPQHQAQLIHMGGYMAATNECDDLLWPFFDVEFKGDGGSMWVATNQCLGGSASCVNIAERLHRQLKLIGSGDIQAFDSAAFSMAINGSEARLYISWKQSELDYYMAHVKSFLLIEPSHYIEFHKYVRNIIDWGGGKRLNDIRDSLSLLDESRKRTLPSGASAASMAKKCKSSRSRGYSSASTTAREPSVKVPEDTTSQDTRG